MLEIPFEQEILDFKKEFVLWSNHQELKFQTKAIYMNNDFKFCPLCASQNISNINNRKWECPDCGFVLYNNSAAAVGVIITNDSGQILLEVRAKEPKPGLLDIPGGFLEHDETTEQACIRECCEELGIELTNLKYLCTLPNTYEYKNVQYKTCDAFFVAKIKDNEKFNLQPDEVSNIKWYTLESPQDIANLPLAFDNAYHALEFYIKNK